LHLRNFRILTILLVATVAFQAFPARAATITGTVRNGTSGKPAGGIDVLLIQLVGEMKPVANTKTGPDGKYTLESPAVGRDTPPMPMLVRAIYRGVNFHQPLPPGQTAADVTVYEPTSDPKTVTFSTRVLMFQPNGQNLMVVDEYGLQNNSQPPVALYNANGDFEFELPEGAENSQVSSWGPSKMPVNQGTIDKGKGKFAIAYAFQPGENGVRVSYQVPYASNSATLKLVSTHGAARVGLIAPAGLQIQGAGFTPQGQEQGYNLYARDAVAAGTTFEVAISGTAPVPAADQGDGQPSGGGNNGANAVQVLPNRLDSLKWLLLGGFVTLFGLGLFSIWRRPVMAGTEIAALPAPAAEASRSKAARKRPVAPTDFPSQPPARPSPAVAPPSPVASLSGESVSAVTREVEQNLDGLKDRLFRLELRRQAGTVSEEEYLRERTQAEKVLRELVGR
jgi:hypothetical protein